MRDDRPRTPMASPLGLHLVLRKNPWLWLIPILLFAVFLAGRRLNSLTFTVDETWTLINVGARNYGPYTPAQALASDQTLSPDQAFGWTILINRWGAVAGWNTVSMRAWPFFLGLLALAVIYRAGRSMFGQQAGVIASLLLVSSSLALQYFHVARAFTPVLLFSTLTLWCYWRIALDRRKSDRFGQAGLLLGGIGLFYSHYLAALVVPVVMLFHLLFVRKDRDWWRSAIILVLIAIAAVPEFVVLGKGVEHRFRRQGNVGPGIDVGKTLIHLLYVFTNGVIRLPNRVSAVIPIVLTASLLLLHRTRSRHRHPENPGPAWFLAVVALVFLFLTLALNHFVQVLTWNRMRYFLAIWPPALLLLAGSICKLGQKHQRLADWILVSLATSGIVVILLTPFYEQLDFHEDSVIHLADQALVQHARPNDLLLLSEAVLPFDPLNREYYLKVWEFPLEILSAEDDTEHIALQYRANSRVWLLATAPDSAIEQSLAAQMFFCQRPVRRGDLVLTLYARSEADCA